MAKKQRKTLIPGWDAKKRRTPSVGPVIGMDPLNRVYNLRGQASRYGAKHGPSTRGTKGKWYYPNK